MVRIANLALLLAAGLSLSLAAIDVTSPELLAFAWDLGDLVPDTQRAMLAEATIADDVDDQYHPSGPEPGIAPAEVDIALAASFGVEMTAAASSAQTGSGGTLNCRSDGTICPTSRAGQPVGTSFHAYAGTMRAPLLPRAGQRLEFGVVAYDASPRDGRPAEAWQAIPEFPGDFFQGSNVAWSLVSESGEPYRLFRLEYGPGDAGFLAAPTDAIAIVRGSAWAILVPGSEWEGTVSGRVFVFRADGGDTSPETSVVDTYPDIFEPPQPSAGTPTIAIESAPSRGVPVGWLVAGAGAGLVVVFFGAWVFARRRGSG
jgi:hypothetical protein